MRIDRDPMLLAVLVSLLAVGCSDPFGPGVADPHRVTIPASIDASGGADVTDELNSFFSSTPDSSTISFPANARYRVEGTLMFVNRRSLTIEGNGATVVATTDGSGVTPPATLAHLWPRGRRHFLFRGGSNLVVRNLKVTGANPNAGIGDLAYSAALEAQHGFEFSGVQGGELDHVTVNDVYGDFVYFGASSGILSLNIQIHDSDFERNGRQGMSFTGAQNILIERNNMSQVRRAHFDLEPNLPADSIRQVTIRDNQFGPGRLLFLASGGAAGTIEDIIVQGNTLTGKPLTIEMTPPIGSRRSRIRIIGNVSDASFGSTIPLMQFTRVDGLEVRANRNPLQANRSMVGVGAKESCNVVVADNEFLNAVAQVRIEAPTCVP